MGHTEEGPAVHAICGLVCAGKTTLARKLASELDGVRFFATIFQPPDADEGVAVDHIRIRDP